METRLTRLGEALARACPEMLLAKDMPMSACTTLRLGGPADLLAEPADTASLRLCLAAAREEDVPVTVVGRGSNLLVLDGGIRGLVIRVGRAMRAIRREGDALVCEAGAGLNEAARAAADLSLAGLAFAHGIPGTLGGGTVMNAGAYGGELAQVVALVEGVLPDGAPFRRTAEEMAFSYRHSALQETGGIVTRVTLSLTPGDRGAIEKEMRDLAARRAEKQPLTLPSAGSTFKRPAGGYAAAMIDACGLKGTGVGGAQVSEKHAGFLVNRGGTAADFLALMRLVEERVRERFGVTLEPEVRILGEP